jgi:ATP/maltotriose-dependent transcriptional regulator MalT
LDKLLAIQTDYGQPVTPDVREHLARLQLRALKVAHPHEYRVRQVNDELEIALTGKLEAERYARALEEQLADRNRQVFELAEAKGRLRAAWDADRVAMQAEYERLTQEIDEITEQLNLARERGLQADRHCQQLEDLLNNLHTFPSAEEDSTGVRFPIDDPDGVTRQGQSPLDALSPMQRRVLSLLAEGRSNAGIAAELFVADMTVERHIADIFIKLGLAGAGDVNRRVLATRAFLRHSGGARPRSISS